jgi:two-component system sensor histidine kinase KdpD
LRDAELRNKLLAESERLGRTLLNSVSHELRTPISAISGAAGSLRESQPLTPLQQKLAAEIESGSSRLNRVVQSLLSAARIQAGQIRPNLDWCDVRDVVRLALLEVKELTAGRPVQVDIPAELPLLKADSVLMEQILVNLLINAGTHTPPGTAIEVKVRASRNQMILEVADRGPGLPPEELERVFDLFHRMPRAKPGGTGLGLAIVKGFTEAQNGTVQAGNRPEGGAVFALAMPLSKPPSLPEEWS